MIINFHGGARTVTGSKHLITLNNGFTLLLDCGMFQGLGSKTIEMNQDLGFDPRNVDVVLLSHAHIDHSGLLPFLLKQGFTGKVYCTPATKELSEILLYDSAEIQRMEFEQMSKLRSTDKEAYSEPLYTSCEVEEILKNFELVSYNEPIQLHRDVKAVFQNAGHLIGAATIHLTIEEDNETTTILYSGDIGRYRSPLLQEPFACQQADFVILESTYGDSSHDPNFSTVDPLLKIIKKTCLQRKGKLVIPAFSVGRTQEVLYALNQLELEHRLPELPYFVDSPLGAKATQVIKHHMEHFNDRLQQILSTDDDPFDFKGLKYIDNPEDSKRLVAYEEPCVIISASGTADAGRVRHHLCSTLEDPNNGVLLVGYCQEQSLGGQLKQGRKKVEINGVKCNVYAEINSLKSLSAHGDTDDLVKFLCNQDPDLVQQVFLVHGEYETQVNFSATLERKGFKNVMIPSLHQSFKLEKKILPSVAAA